MRYNFIDYIHATHINIFNILLKDKDKYILVEDIVCEKVDVCFIVYFNKICKLSEIKFPYWVEQEVFPLSKDFYDGMIQLKVKLPNKSVITLPTYTHSQVNSYCIPLIR